MTGTSFGSHRAAAFAGLRAALGFPGLILGSTYIGMGALFRESGFALWQGMVSTATAWAAPGQIVFVELASVGASLFAITAAVALTNARLLPMTVVLVPWLRGERVPIWLLYLSAHFIAVTGWAQAMRVCPKIPEAERMPYFLGCAVMLWLITLCCTYVGYELAGVIPSALALGLVFLNPIYFMLVFASDLGNRGKVLALSFGAVAGPLLHVASPDWGLLLTGLLAGSLAFFAARLGPPRGTGPA